MARRQAVLDRLTDVARNDARIAALWLQGSLARGDADPFSDIDAYLAIDDAAFDGMWTDRMALLEKIGRPYAWSDATTPGLKAVHALLEGGVKLDLLLEPLSKVGQQKRPAIRVLFDRGGVEAQLSTGYEPPQAVIAHIIGVIIKMTRQGATWPLRLLHRDRWSTLAMMELDLINQQIAQLMVVQSDPANFYMNAFSYHRLLNPAQQATIADLTRRALVALSAQDAAALKAVHLDVYDALAREGRNACAALGAAYPLGDAEERDLRTLLEREWPA
ncbi:MAG TPA: nucleotidyltransferase domain-containing protein [Rhizomicrobium sp.]|nr:nucleotidyltransferase domain-containing protein [Rhizomicrobium sp.]